MIWRSISDEERFGCVKKQNKLSQDTWKNVDIEEVVNIHDGINDLKVYNVKGESIPATGGRRWKKNLQTQWKHYGKVRYSSSQAWQADVFRNALTEFKLLSA